MNELFGFVSRDEGIARDGKRASIKRGLPKNVLDGFPSQEALEIRQ